MPKMKFSGGRAEGEGRGVGGSRKELGRVYKMGQAPSPFPIKDKRPL